MEDAFVTGVVFLGIYFVIKVFTDFLLKRKLIAAGHVDKAEILHTHNEKEESGYPTLKWGLVTLFAGAGLLIIALIDKNGDFDWMNGTHSFMTIGVELVAISLGFLTYFMIIRLSKK
jgi:hypothetical protein